MKVIRFSANTFAEYPLVEESDIEVDVGMLIEHMPNMNPLSQVGFKNLIKVNISRFEDTRHVSKDFSIIRENYREYRHSQDKHIMESILKFYGCNLPVIIPISKIKDYFYDDLDPMICHKLSEYEIKTVNLKDLVDRPVDENLSIDNYIQIVNHEYNGKPVACFKIYPIITTERSYKIYHFIFVTDTRWCQAMVDILKQELDKKKKDFYNAYIKSIDQRIVLSRKYICSRFVESPGHTENQFNQEQNVCGHIIEKSYFNSDYNVDMLVKAVTKLKNSFTFYHPFEIKVGVRILKSSGEYMQRNRQSTNNNEQNDQQDPLNDLKNGIWVTVKLVSPKLDPEDYLKLGKGDTLTVFGGKDNIGIRQSDIKIEDYHICSSLKIEEIGLWRPYGHSKTNQSKFISILVPVFTRDTENYTAVYNLAVESPEVGNRLSRFLVEKIHESILDTVESAIGKLSEQSFATRKIEVIKNEK